MWPGKYCFQDIRLLLLNLIADGEIIWAREYGDGPYESLGFISEVSGNRYLFGGRMSLVDGPYFVQTDADGYSACLTEVFNFTVNEMSADVYSPQVITEDPDVEPMSPTFEEASLTLSEEIICTGIVAVESISAPKSFISVYPNPAENFITVVISDNSRAGFGIELHNMQGELIYRSVMHNQKKVIETPFNSGIYFLTIRNCEANSFYRQKFVIR